MRMNKENSGAVQDANIAIIVSRFNEPITEALYSGAIERLQELSFSLEQVTSIQVPGAVEAPLIAKKLAMTNRYDAIIVLGAVIRGETSHYDYVCDQVSQGCQQVMMQFDLPVIFGVLTTENKTQALDRVGGRKGHKGKDAVDCAFEMIALCRELA